MLEGLPSRPIPISTEAHRAAETRLEELATTMSSKRACVDAADAAAREWERSGRASEEEQAADWKAGRDFLMLNTRADAAEDYAAACFELACAAAREAAHALIAAGLARNDADVASLPEGMARR
jgi:hypothetical protein